MPSPSEIARTLPIYDCESEIIDTIRENQVVVIQGATGSGKTTQIPRILRRALGAKRIAVTQPRRIAAVSVAWRIAAEEQVNVGEEVGYAIRFDDMSGPNTAIKLMTDGILLTEARHDPLLENYDVIMIDEAHERSLNIDVILGLVHRTIPKRHDLRVLISSATLAPEKFQEFFAPVAGDVPLLTIPARTYPIDITYRPPETSRWDDLIEAVVEDVLDIHYNEAPGHILVFLSGAADIRRIDTELTAEVDKSEMVVLPLYGRMKREEQERIFDDFGSRRKVVLATNVAETSITIPDVRYVVDSGLAKVPSYSVRTGITALREQPISRGSAEQRAGRAGRTAPGKVWRLYSKESFDERPALTREEILRVELTEVVLRLIDLGIRDVEEFPFPTAPPKRKIAGAIDTLVALQAIDEERNLTSIGRRMVPFPLSPALARMVIEAAENFPKVVDDVLVVGAFLSSRAPYVMPEGRVREARRAHRTFYHPLGDAVAQVKLFRAWQRSKDQENFCERNFLDPEIMAFASKAHEQLCDIAREQEIEVLSGGSPEEVVQSVAAGLADRIIKCQGRVYETLSGVRVSLHPSSVLSDDRPQYAVAAELVAHARSYAINISAIRPEWIPQINPQAAERLGVRSRRTKGNAARPAAPTSIDLGHLKLDVHHGRGKPCVTMTLAELHTLHPVAERPVEPEHKRLRARVQWTDECTFAPIAIPKLLSALRRGAYPAVNELPPDDLPLGNLMEPDRHWHALHSNLQRTLRPAANKRSAGWIAFVANGAGGYWLDIVPHYADALQASRLSLDALVQELYDGDELRELAENISEQLTGLEAQFKD